MQGMLGVTSYKNIDMDLHLARFTDRCNLWLEESPQSEKSPCTPFQAKNVHVMDNESHA